MLPRPSDAKPTLIVKLKTPISIMKKMYQPIPAGYEQIFCRFITRNGKRIYPKKAQFFRFLVKIKE